MSEEIEEEEFDLVDPKEDEELQEALKIKNTELNDLNCRIETLKTQIDFQKLTPVSSSEKEEPEE